MTPSPAVQPPRRSPDLKAWLPSRQAIWWILGAFALGLVLFAFVLRGAKDDFYRAGPASPTAATPDYAPLPVPMTGDGTDGVSRQAPPPSARAPDEERPRLVETAPPPPAAAPRAAPRPVAPAASSKPQVISSPAPRYPARALRRGERGTVLISVQIGVDGVPEQVDVVQSSGSRDLDRAAADAVRRWRFRPAMSGEQPVSGRVLVPIDFKP